METDQANSVASIIQEISQSEEAILQYARDAVKKSAKTFVGQQIGKLFGLASVYKRAFDRMGVQTKAEMEEKIKHFFRFQVVREAFDDWLEAEDAWDKFLLDVDHKLGQKRTQPLREGQKAPLDVPLVDARTGGEFWKLRAQIVVISFGAREGALRWLEDTGCPFQLLLDKDRDMYNMFGLEVSVSKVWNIACMVYYAEMMRAGKELPSPYANINDDPNQMGGDFVLASDGQVLLTHCSRSSTDRPSVDNLLQVLSASVPSTM